MTDANKPLQFKHAHITGQAMRDHWGPIVERIAAETADWRDKWIYDLITENEKLREAMRDAIGEIETAAPLTGSDILSAALGETE